MLSSLRMLRQPVQRQAVGMAQRRNLGTTVKGTMNQFAEVWTGAKNLVVRPGITYLEYKHQCMCMRVFAFAFAAGGCGLSLFLDPPKSSYWVNWHPLCWPGNLMSVFSQPKRNVFLEAPDNEPDASGPTALEAASQLITKRRLDSEGGDDH